MAKRKKVKKKKTIRRKKTTKPSAKKKTKKKKTIRRKKTTKPSAKKKKKKKKKKTIRRKKTTRPSAKKKKKKVIKRRKSTKPPAKKKKKKKKTSKIQPASKEIIEGILIGRVDDYYAKVGVIALIAESSLKVGDTIRVKGHTTDFVETVSSMQINHESVEIANKGDSIGIKVSGKTRRGDCVYRIDP